MPWLHALSRRFGYPLALVITLLQRSPIVRFAGWMQEWEGLVPSSVLRGGAVLAALGAVDTVAGASAPPVAVQSTSGKGISLTAGQPMQQVAFSLTNESSYFPDSWAIVSGNLPAGVTLAGGSQYASAPITGPGTINDTSGFVVLSGTPTASGSYPVQIVAYENPGGASKNTSGSGTTPFTFTLTVTGSVVTAPTITQQPQSQSTTVGSSVTLTVGVSDGSATIVWTKNGQVISGATNTTLAFSSIQLSDAGSYVAKATNSAGSATSSTAVLTVNPAPTPPVVAIQPISVNVFTGGTAVLSASVTGATSYQWYHGTTAVSGATSGTLLLSNVTTGNNTGSYFLSAANSAGAVQTNTVSVTATSSASFGRLINLSVLTNAGSSHVLTVGFTTGGNATSGQQSLLVRGTGPALSGLSVPNVLPDPTLAIISQSSHATLYSNDNWGTPSSNIALINAADTSTQAFPLTNTSSLDAALVETLPAGGYSVQLSGNGTATGNALAEVYDTTPSSAFTVTTPRLINLSCLSSVTGGGTLVAGFTIDGTTSRTVLVRATGPALSGLGVTNVMPDPQLVLASTSTQATLASNAGWGGDPQITAVSNSVLAFQLTDPNSKDSVLMMTLPPGGYSATASSVSGAAGTCLIEVYEVP